MVEVISVLEIKNYSKSYNSGVYAVKDLSLTVSDGDIYAFVGHNGAGKTTTLKAIAGILDFTEGDILINGVSIKENHIACLQQIAYIPDNPDLYEHLTGIGYINFIADIYGVSESDRSKRIKEYSEKLDIEKDLGNIISSYSHGMKQKVAIIAALVHDPKILILDEPFVGLDPNASHALKEIMKDLCSKKRSIFFSTHVLEVAEKLCNKIAIINNGKLIKSGQMTDVVKDKSLEEIFIGLVSHE